MEMLNVMYEKYARYEMKRENAMQKTQHEMHI